MADWWVSPLIGGVLGAILTLILYKFSCRHAWELVDKTEFAPPWDSLPAGQRFSPDDFKWLHTRVVVLALRCPRCGAARIEKVKST